jgi:hypothetical protein
MGLLRPACAVLSVLLVPACSSPKRDAEALCDVRKACGITGAVSGPDKQQAIAKCLDGKITSQEGKKWRGGLATPGLDPAKRAEMLGEIAKSQGLDSCPDAAPAPDSR